MARILLVRVSMFLIDTAMKVLVGAVLRLDLFTRAEIII